MPYFESIRYLSRIQKFRQIVDCAAKEPKVVVQNSNAQHTATSLSSHSRNVQTPLANQIRKNELRFYLPPTERNQGLR